jgi:ribosome-associated heat shock protein Hsp15
MHRDETASAEVRLDKWLWAARFFKTRALAAESAGGGKIEINGERAKPSRSVRVGDRLCIRRGPFIWMVVVKDTLRLRGPAPQAQQLYEETEESARQRAAAAAQLKLERPPKFAPSSRPSKRDRRVIARFTKRDR